MDLAPWRLRADPLADDAVAALFTAGIRGDPLESVRSSSSPACLRFVEETRTLPRFYDAAALAAGRRAATRHAPLTFLVLLAGSLVESFAVAQGAAVLVKTGRLQRDTTRRIYETATLVRELLFEGGERPGQRAHDSLLRVRLLHAFVRRWVASAGFDQARLGVPVNQMDMLHTLLVFSHVVTRGLGRLGVRWSDDERASWCALWRLAGHVLGVDPALSFTNEDDELDRYRLVHAHYAPDDGSRALAHAVLGGLAGEPPFFLPKRALDQIARTLLEDDALADAFSLARAPLYALATSAGARGVRALDIVTRRLPFGTDVGVLAGRAFIEANRWRVLRNMKPADYSFRTA